MKKQSPHDDLFRSYGPGKFDTYATELLYEESLEGGADDACGDVETTNWYGFMNGPFDHPQLKKFAGAILEEDDRGFVVSKFFTSKDELKKKWKKICEEIEGTEGDDGS